MTEGVSLSNEEGIVLYTNPAEDAMFGYEPGELIGKHVTILNAYEPDENQRIVTEVIQQLKTRGSWSGEFENRKKDGIFFTTQARITSLELGGKRLWVCVHEDITDRKQQENALRESEERFRTIADSTPVLIWMSGPHKEGEYFNHQWLEFTGKSIEEEKGDGWLNSIHPDDLGNLEACSVAFEERRPFTTQFRLRRYDGEYRHMLDIGVPRFTVHNSFQGFTGSCSDITDLKLLEEERTRLIAH